MPAPQRLTNVELNQPYSQRDFDYSGFERKGVVDRGEFQFIRFDKGNSHIYLGFLLQGDKYVLVESYNLLQGSREVHKGALSLLEETLRGRASIDGRVA